MALKRARPMLRTANVFAAKLAPKVAAPFYGTPEHKAWRKLVIDRAQGVCQTPGCGRIERRMFADHIVELKDGGSGTDPANGQCLCGSCHTRKTTAERGKRLWS
jgi:5-methylcytosine-specific restriction endonuclease McrA